MESTDLNIASGTLAHAGTQPSPAQRDGPATATRQEASKGEGEGQGAAVVAEDEEERRRKKKEKRRDDKDDDDVYLPFKVAAAVPISPDTKLFRLRAPPGHGHLLRTLPGPVSHIRVRATLPPLPHDPTTSELLKRRPYTILRRFPQQTPEAEEEEHVEVMIKRYDTFGLSALLHSLNEGDTVQLQLSDRDKHAKMNFSQVHLRHKHVGIVTAGTALAPMISHAIAIMQIMRSVLYNAEANDTRLTLLYANRHEEDILLRKELEEMWEAHPSRLTVYFLLSQPRSEDWGPHTSPYQLRGRITKDMFENVLPPPPSRAASSSTSEEEAQSAEANNAQQTDPLVLVCGPKPFKKLALQFLEELNYAPHMYYKL